MKSHPTGDPLERIPLPDDCREYLAAIKPTWLFRLCDTRTLERGLSYFIDERVTNPSLNWEERTFNCEVDGSERYKTQLKLKDDGFGHRCNCPAHAQYGVCKHVIASAALFFYLSRNYHFTFLRPSDSYLVNVASAFRNSFSEELEISDRAASISPTSGKNKSIAPEDAAAYLSVKIREFGDVVVKAHGEINEHVFIGLGFEARAFYQIHRTITIAADEALDEMEAMLEIAQQNDIGVYFEGSDQKNIALQAETVTANLAAKLDYQTDAGEIVYAEKIDPPDAEEQVVAWINITSGILRNGRLLRVELEQERLPFLDILSWEVFPRDITFQNMESPYGAIERDAFNDFSLLFSYPEEDMNTLHQLLRIDDEPVKRIPHADSSDVEVLVNFYPVETNKDPAIYGGSIEVHVEGEELPLLVFTKHLIRSFFTQEVGGLFRSKKRLAILLECALMLLEQGDENEECDTRIQELLNEEVFQTYFYKPHASRWLLDFANDWCYASKEPCLVALPDTSNPWRLISGICHKLATLILGLHNPQTEDDLAKLSPELRVTEDNLPNCLQQAATLANQIGADIRFENQPIQQQEMAIDVYGEESDKIDWFELRAEVRCQDLTIAPEEWDKLIHGQLFLQQKGTLVVADKPQQEALKKLRGMLGEGGTSKSPESTEEILAQVPRLQMLDWLELRKQGVNLHLPEETEALFQSLESLEGIPEQKPPKTLQADLRHYQQQGYEWLAFLYQHRFGACLADDMGLGKTLQTIAFLNWLHEHPDARQTDGPHLIVVPPSLVFNWINEIERFAPSLTIYSHVGATRKWEAALENDLIITTYDLVRKDHAKIKEQPFDVMVFDETQTLKNLKAERTKAALKLQRRFTLCLTGTPVENHAGEYYSIMNLALPGLLGDYRAFKKAIKIEDYSVLRRARPFVLRRTKEHILKELPPKVENDLYLDMTEEQKEIYTRTVGEVRQEVMQAYKDKPKAQAGIVALSALLRLRQVCVSPEILGRKLSEPAPKIQYLLEKMLELQGENHAALIFSQFTRTLDLVESYANAEGLPLLRLDGKTPSTQRKKRIETFQNSDTPHFFLVSLKAGGVGLNLTRANYIFHADPWWNPSVENQASDRAHRIGQTQTVFVQRVLMRHSIEEKIMQLKSKKQELFDTIVETSGAEKKQGKLVTKDDFDYLLS